MRFYTIFVILISGKLFSQGNQSVSASDQAKGAQYAANDFVGLYETKKVRYDQQQTVEKIADLKSIYESYESYPDSIITGWHEVVVTDNAKIFKAAKVYVSNNRIRKFFIDNCIGLEFTTDGDLTKGKAIITLKKVSGDPLRTIDIYFMDDLDKPTTFPPPSEPGYVCFWTGERRSLGREIIFAGKEIEAVSEVFENVPECFDAGTTTVIIKPGIYKLEILKSGNNLDSVVNVQAGICTYYELK